MTSLRERCIKESKLKHNNKYIWAICIPTITERENTYNEVVSELQKQIIDFGVFNLVTIISEKDNGQNSIGYKHNKMYLEADSDYVSIMDDDDLPLDGYISEGLKALMFLPDVVTFNVKVTNKKTGSVGAMFHHAGIEKTYHKDGNWYKPPCHVNIIKRTIALAHPFIHIDKREKSDKGSDVIFMLDLLNSGTWKNCKYMHVPEELYHYRYDPSKKDPKKKLN
jgi:hypothetical protein